MIWLGLQGMENVGVGFVQRKMKLYTHNSMTTMKPSSGIVDIT